MKKLTNDILLERFSKIHGDKYEYDFNSIINGKITILCKKHGCFVQKIDDHLHNHGCKQCGIEKVTQIRRESIENLISRSNKVHNYKYNYSLVKNVKNMNEHIIIICPEHGEFRTVFNYHINSKQGCPQCAVDRTRDDLKSFTEKANKKHNDLFDYSKVNYINSESYVDIICKKHGIFSQKPNCHLMGDGCPKCKTSKGEKIILNYLTENDITYEYQKKFKECKHIKPLIFDFFIPDKNLIIEFDGEQHETLVEYWGGHIGLEKRKKYDKIKNDFCLENGIQLVRINHKKNIHKTLNSILKLS